jgi:hypothetical protein
MVLGGEPQAVGSERAQEFFLDENAALSSSDCAMNHGNQEFEQSIDKELQAHGLRFKGIRLKCRQCGEPALAGSVTLAETFGWIELTHIGGPNYEGLCISCGKQKG